MRKKSESNIYINFKRGGKGVAAQTIGGQRKPALSLFPEAATAKASSLFLAFFASG